MNSKSTRPCRVCGKPADVNAADKLCRNCVKHRQRAEALREREEEYRRQYELAVFGRAYEIPPE